MNKEEAQELVDGFQKAISEWWHWRERDRKKAEEANQRTYEYKYKLLVALSQPDLSGQIMKITIDSERI